MSQTSIVDRYYGFSADLPIYGDSARFAEEIPPRSRPVSTVRAVPPPRFVPARTPSPPGGVSSSATLLSVSPPSWMVSAQARPTSSLVEARVVPPPPPRPTTPPPPATELTSSARSHSGRRRRRSSGGAVVDAAAAVIPPISPTALAMPGSIHATLDDLETLAEPLPAPPQPPLVSEPGAAPVSKDTPCAPARIDDEEEEGQIKELLRQHAAATTSCQQDKKMEACQSAGQIGNKVFMEHKKQLCQFCSMSETSWHQMREKALRDGLNTLPKRLVGGSEVTAQEVVAGSREKFCDKSVTRIQVRDAMSNTVRVMRTLASELQKGTSAVDLPEQLLSSALLVTTKKCIGTLLTGGADLLDQYLKTPYGLVRERPLEDLQEHVKRTLAAYDEALDQQMRPVVQTYVKRALESISEGMLLYNSMKTLEKSKLGSAFFALSVAQGQRQNEYAFGWFVVWLSAHDAVDRVADFLKTTIGENAHLASSGVKNADELVAMQTYMARAVRNVILAWSEANEQFQSSVSRWLSGFSSGRSSPGIVLERLGLSS